MSINDIREQLVLNPNAGLTLTVKSPIRQRHHQIEHFSLSNPRNNLARGVQMLLEGRLLESLVQLLNAGGEVAKCPQIPTEHLEALQRLNLLLLQDEVAIPPVYQPQTHLLHPLLPQLRDWNLPAHLQVNELRYLQHDEAPLELIRYHFPYWLRLPATRPILWCRHPRYQSWFPNFLPPDLLDFLLSPQVDLGQLAPDTRQALYGAAVLVEQDYADSEQSAAELQSCREHLEEHGYWVLRDLIPPQHLAYLRQYMRDLLENGYFSDGDDMLQERFAIHNEPLMMWLHGQIFQQVKRIAPIPIKPSYTYLGLYHSNAVMDSHSDRPQCVWNVTLAVDMEPERSGTESWPLILEPPEGDIPIHLNLGDGVLYAGERVAHRRDRLPDGERFTACIFHFVHRDYEGHLD